MEQVKEEVEDLTAPEKPLEVQLEEIVPYICPGQDHKTIESGLKAVVALIKEKLKTLTPDE